ncbi:hypothetical protein Tcan_01999 [Toxocara canis]|uniref:Uncharacterized protein n=1 Tax=Toxocara canis TaxID=6265 RepID=A0A0B2VM68_TOXCA|nr:hypothetical protein Tcan_01999 [Toxocara canis]
MVLLNLPKNSQVAAASNCELILESGRCIRYVAPAHANPTKEIYTESVTSLESDKAHSVTRKRSSYDEAIVGLQRRRKGDCFCFEAQQ